MNEILRAVNSSAIRAVGYVAGTLIVVFRSGRRYDHPGVPEWVWRDFLAAGSMGAFYNQYIRGRYR